VKLFCHYCTSGFSNCYILGTDFEETETAETETAETGTPGTRTAGTETLGASAGSREAIIIDPGHMDKTLIRFIEDNNYTLRGILITHDHINHVRGLKTLKRIYDVPVYGMNPVIRDYSTIMVKDEETVRIGSFEAEVISVPGHSADSAVYKIGRFLFSGDALSAGMVGRTVSSYAATNQFNALRNKLLALPGDYMVFPGHGPPTTMEAERRFNYGIQFFEEQKKKRPTFKIDF
jgi:glyoxylase-like metal-dependent hydrolase (beta-lactamase superfamily II)